MSCALMYQPYAMSYSSCDRITSAAERQKLFRFPHVPSPPDSSNSTGGSPSSSSYNNVHSSSTSNFTLPLIPPPPGAPAPHPHPFNYHHPHPHNLNLNQLPLSPNETSPVSQRSSSSSRRSVTPCATVTSATTGCQNSQEYEGPPAKRAHHDLDLPHTVTSGSSTSSSSSSRTSHHSHPHSQSHNSHHHQPTTATITSGHGHGHGHGTSQSQSAARAQYISSNCVVYESYEGDSAHEVDDHFTRALAYGAEKTSAKSTPMSLRNFPPSFWNAAYQPPPPPSRAIGGYGHSDFYGTTAMEYPGGISMPLHPQSDPWHYPYHHQGYHHHRAADFYNPMPSTSRFNPAQYSSFLFPSTGTTPASRFSGLGKGDTTHWGSGGRYHQYHPHHHESSWSDFHIADYSAAAAHYSNITAGSNF